ncbi:MAG: hypothetical protein ACFFE4_06610 [Candidatus Thorarchaeota archaeon]
MNIIERMFDSIPDFKEKIKISYEDIYSVDAKKRYGDLNPPAIFFQNKLLTEGHVPIMKKLAQDLFRLIK